MKVGAFIIGAQKAGTTSLFNHLALHSNLLTAKVKELNYFSSDKNFEKGTFWYHRQFGPNWIKSLLQSNATYLDATPEYLYYPQVARRIKEYNPKARFIVLLRNPIDRAFSAWNMFKNLHEIGLDETEKYIRFYDQEVYSALYRLLSTPEFPSFIESIESELKSQSIEPSFLKRGLYARQLKPYFELFSKESIMVIEENEFRENTRFVLDRCTDHLKLPKANWPNNFNEFHSRTYLDKLSDEERRLLVDYYKEPNKELFSLLGKNYFW
ncbi:MAG: sulfotransferase domain-containing protein [Vicingaceae bacterium]